MKRYTSYTDRQEIVVLHQQGHSYRQIAQQTGWSFEAVRKICRAYQREGETALQSQPLGRPASGPLSTFDPLVRWASLRIKCQHRGWGPEVVLAELANRSWASRVKLPSATQIRVYFSQFGDRLIRVQPHKQLPQAEPLEPTLRIVHGCWQIDTDEGVDLPGYGQAHIFNLVDYASGLKIGSSLWPAYQQGRQCRVSWPQMQHTLRQAFSKWAYLTGSALTGIRSLLAGATIPFPSASPCGWSV